MSLRREWERKFGNDIRRDTAGRLRALEANRAGHKEIEPSFYRGTSLEPLVEQLRSTPWIARLGKRYRSAHAEYGPRRNRLIGERAQAIRLGHKGAVDRLLSSTPLDDYEMGLLSVESLSQMSYDDYHTLSRRLRGGYACHVTRYGIRENVMDLGILGLHSWGQGEFINSFKDLLAAGRLQSSINLLLDPGDPSYIQELAVQAARRCPKKSFSQHLDDFVFTLTEDDCVAAERESVHFTTNLINSGWYGGEHGYDIYILFPAEALAHNFHHTAFEETPDKKHNDACVFAPGGIPLDMGVVCIPAGLSVDLRTGSQYALDEAMNPIIRPELRGQLATDSDNWLDTVIGIAPELAGIYCGASASRDHDLFHGPVVSEISDAYSVIEGGLNHLAYLLGFQDERTAHEYLFRVHFAMQNINRNFPEDEWHGEPEEREALVREMLERRAGLRDFYANTHQLYERADPAITSQQYWENHFAENPAHRPSKVRFYRHPEGLPYGRGPAAESPRQFNREADIPGYEAYHSERKKRLRKIVSGILAKLPQFDTTQM
ncbi:MAG: hypothetical protein ABH879_03530 [archaeon]